MSNLEWINEQIKECDEMIERLNIRKDEYSKNKSLVKTYNRHIKNLTGLKQRFEQIKSEFESWEFIKRELGLKVIERNCDMFGSRYALKCDYEDVIPLLDKEAESFKKALEAKNECRN